jgi:hypothetical protein
LERAFGSGSGLCFVGVGGMILDTMSGTLSLTGFDKSNTGLSKSKNGRGTGLLSNLDFLISMTGFVFSLNDFVRLNDDELSCSLLVVFGSFDVNLDGLIKQRPPLSFALSLFDLLSSD